MVNKQHVLYHYLPAFYIIIHTESKWTIFCLKEETILKYLTRNHLIEISQGLIISKKLMQKSKSNRFIQKKAKKSKKNPTGTKYFNLNKLTDSRKL